MSLSNCSTMEIEKQKEKIKEIEDDLLQLNAVVPESFDPNDSRPGSRLGPKRPSYTTDSRPGSRNGPRKSIGAGSTRGSFVLNVRPEPEDEDLKTSPRSYRGSLTRRSESSNCKDLKITASFIIDDRTPEMIKKEEAADATKKWLESLKTLAIKLFIIFCTVMTGYFVYKHYEGWSLLETVYFTVVTCTTVGYGDFFPTKLGSRLFTIVYIFVGIIFIFSIISDAATGAVEYIEDKLFSKSEAHHKFKEVDWKQKVFTAAVLMILVLLTGSVAFMYIENLHFSESFYFCIVTSTSVGYGDYGPASHTGKIFAIFYILASISLVAFSLTRFASAKIERDIQIKEKAMLEKKLDFTFIQEMDTDGNGVDKLEFLVGILTQLGVLDKERHVDPWLEKFDELDGDGSGKLDASDIAFFEQALLNEESKLALMIEEEEHRRQSEAEKEANRLSEANSVTMLEVDENPTWTDNPSKLNSMSMEATSL